MEQSTKTEPVNKYAPKMKVGGNPTVKGPGNKVTTVGLGKLQVIHAKHG